MSKNNVIKTVKDSISQFLEDNGLELYNIEYVKEGRDRVLRVFIDRKWVSGTDLDSVSGISTDDCEKTSRYISDFLDKEDLIDERYILEVSSPGMDRTLYKNEHVRRYKGKDVEISLYKAIDGRKRITGKLGELEDDVLDITTDAGIVLRLPVKSISKIKLKIVI